MVSVWIGVYLLVWFVLVAGFITKTVTPFIRLLVEDHRLSQSSR